MRDETGERVDEAKRLSRKIQPMLRGKDMEVQGAVLADLMSIWLAGIWPEEARSHFLGELVQVAQRMAPLSERDVFGPKGHPLRRRPRHSATVVPFPAPAPKP